MAAGNQIQKKTKNSICWSCLGLRMGNKRMLSHLAMVSEYSVSFDQMSSHSGLQQEKPPTHQAQPKLSY